MRGVVHLVGAGPGDPALLTRRGEDLLRRADAVVYDGLVNPVLLGLAPPEAERIYAGKKRAGAHAPMTQEAICARLVELARAGKRVVRLKGGDPFVFGRGAEECRALAGAGIPFEVVPGVTSATAVAAYAGIPLTARRIASTVAFATGHEAAGKPHSAVDWRALAHAGTVVLFMALKTARECAANLIAAGKDPRTPAAAIYWGTTASQRSVVAPLDELADAIDAAALKPPVLIVVGDVVGFRGDFDWFEARPLFGARAVVTRGIEQARAFAHELAELGAEVVVTPVTRIVPAATAEHRAAIDAAFADLGRYRWVILTSANAVTRFFDQLAARDLDARALGGAKVACIGPATARAAAGRGLVADLIPPRGDSAGVARAILEADGDAVRGGRVLIPRAAYGRDEAVHALTDAGATVDVAPLYTTARADADDPMVVHGLRRLRRREIDVCAFFAPSQVDALFGLLGDEAAELVGACRIVAAIGKTTAAALEARGVAVAVVPSTPDAAVMAREIAAEYARPNHED